MIYKHKKIHILARILAAAYLLSVFSVVVLAASPITQETNEVVDAKIYIKTPKKLNVEPVQFSDITYITYYDKETIIAYSNTIKDNINQLELCILSDDYTKDAVETMNKELVRLQDILATYEVDLHKIATWEQEYYYASKVFEFLLSHGYSREVTCGIIGNMMIECGGHTLKLNPSAYNPSGKYYGLCQWNYGYGLHGSSFEHQLNFLVSNIEREFNVFGKCYKADFNYEDFVSMTEPAEIALAFAKSYERCGSASLNARKQAADAAYSYFTLS